MTEQLLLVVLEKYPELKDIKIEFIWKRMNDAWAKISYNPITITVDRELQSKPRMVQALIAHELSHLCKDLAQNTLPFYKLFAHAFLYNHNEEYRNEMERDVDLDIIRRGFGKEYLEFLKWDDERGEDEDFETHEGLTTQEVEKLVSNS